MLFVCSEATPFAKTGGLAEVAGVLPRHLAARGHDVRLVMPRYASVPRDTLTPVAGLASVAVPFGHYGVVTVEVLAGVIPGSDVPVWFVDHPPTFGREGLYVDPATGHGYSDNAARFALLSRAALEVARAADLAPDVVHVHDWHTAVVPVMLNTVYRDDPRLGRAASVLTIHNMQHQGWADKGLIDLLGVGWGEFTHLSLEAWDQVNLLKGGLYHATLVNTVSPRYAREIATPAFGHGLDGVVRDRGGDCRGILNGCDYDVWDPATDRYLPARYDADDLSGKAACKEALQRELGLEVRADVPVLAVVSRLAEQKGLDVLLAALPRVLGLGVQVALLGSGERWLEDAFIGASLAHPGRVGVRIGYDEQLAHRIEAGGDLFVMPSRFEPCGLNQMYSLAYGTPPIVAAVGGLDDTVTSYHESTDSGTGFKLHDLSPGALFDTIAWAVWALRERPEAFGRLQRRGMAERFTWERAARAYEDLYGEAVARRVGRERRA